MPPQRSFVKWATIGLVVGTLFVITQAIAVGGAAGLLQVGETSALAPIIQAQLGDVPLAEGPGHDGQIYYAMALDLDGDEVGPLLDHAGYRYRRILFPLLASALGSLDGYALLYSMIAVSALSFGVAAGSVAWISTRLGGSDWLALAVVANPGAWLSVRLLTADNLALALMACGLAGVVAGTKLGVASFSLSGLAKDVSLLTPLGLTGRRRLAVAVIPTLLLAIWASWVTARHGGGFSPRLNFTLPFGGIVESWGVWASSGWEDRFYVAFALVATASGIWIVIRRQENWLRWSILLWTAAAICSSTWVWDLGNNAARAFAPLAVLVALAYVSTPTGDPIGDTSDDLTAA